MSIIKENILSVAEYLEIYNQDESVEEDIILGAIHDATITLDAICGGKIALVWDVIDPEDPNFRTEYEHNLIKQAHAIQAHEGVSRNLDFTGGSESYSSGSNNYNQSRTTPNVVADEIIYQLLAQARVYNPNVATDTNIGGIEDERNYYDPTYDPSDNYLTIAVGDNRYIHKVAEDITGSRGKFLKYDINGNISYVSIQEVVGDEYYTKEEVDYLLTNYYTIQAIDEKLAEYYNGDEIDALFANYYDKLQIDEMFENYYTSANVDALLNAKQNRLTAGENITISQVGQDLVISATTEPIGSVAFADITGDPYDNEELSLVLGAKASASDLTTEILARSNGDTQLSNEITRVENLIPTKTSDLTNDSGFITAIDIPPQQQADWNQTATTAVDYIKNKPTTPHLYRHNIIINNNSTTYPIIREVDFNFYSNSSTPIDINTLQTMIEQYITLDKTPFIITNCLINIDRSNVRDPIGIIHSIGGVGGVEYLRVRAHYLRDDGEVEKLELNIGNQNTDIELWRDSITQIF